MSCGCGCNGAPDGCGHAHADMGRRPQWGAPDPYVIVPGDPAAEAAANANRSVRNPYHYPGEYSSGQAAQAQRGVIRRSNPAMTTPRKALLIGALLGIPLGYLAQRKIRLS